VNTQTVQRIITATVTLRVASYRPEEMLKTAEFRKRDLEAWFKRHMPDIETVGSQFDQITLDVSMGVEGEEA
jgi:hypothetical protein